jgi:hypothetical protein
MSRIVIVMLLVIYHRHKRVDEKEANRYVDQDVGEEIIFKWILGINDGVLWTGLIWPRIETGAGLLCTT